MTLTWSCEDTEARMDAYKLGRLDGVDADRLVEHVLQCAYCHSTFWLPFVDASLKMEEELLDEVVGLADYARPRETFGDDTVSEATEPPGPALKRSSTRPASGNGSSELGSAAAPAPAFRLPPIAGRSLCLVGTIVPKVPKPKLMQGYFWYLGTGAPRPERDENTPARLWVECDGTESTVCLQTLEEGPLVDGTPAKPGSSVPLQWTHFVECGPWRYLIQIARAETPWQGLGVVRHSGPSWSLVSNRVRLGRDRSRCHIALRDSGERSNLVWRPKALETVDAAVRKRMEHLTLDAFEVSRTHAELFAINNRVWLRGRSRYPIYRVRGEAFYGLREGDDAPELEAGDLLRIGHQLFEYREG